MKKEAESTINKIDAITRHIRNVEDNCVLLAKKLIYQGEIALARELVANGMIHDASKFFGIEWENMAPGCPCKEEAAKLKLRMAISHHNSTNKHHPEAWAKGIKSMPDVYLAEFCCDIKARSEEFGTSLRDWIDNIATKKWGFTKDDVVYAKIMGYVDLLCEKPFEKI